MPRMGLPPVLVGVHKTAFAAFSIHARHASALPSVSSTLRSCAAMAWMRSAGSAGEVRLDEETASAGVVGNDAWAEDTGVGTGGNPIRYQDGESQGKAVAGSR